MNSVDLEFKLSELLSDELGVPKIDVLCQLELFNLGLQDKYQNNKTYYLVAAGYVSNNYRGGQ